MGTRRLKFAMMSGALKNAGDFLIVKRCRELLEYVYKDAELAYFDRYASMEPYLEEINQMDAMVFCGGPAYLPRLYPDVFPLVKDLDRICIPMFALGLGWFGRDVSGHEVYHYQFTDATKQFLKRIESDTKALGCRDWHSVNVLRNNGIYSGKMTGCPAWYHLEFVERLSFSHTNPCHVKKVCISDPASEGALEKLLDIVAYVRQVFSGAELKVVFHRGIKEDAYTSAKRAELTRKAISECAALSAECVDISYGEEGLSIYDDCDLHLGFRVHAHIYNLSRRNPSILIEEDARGAGVNEALGLGRIASYEHGVRASYDSGRVVASLGTVPNPYLLQQVDDYLNNLYQSDFMQIKNAYQLMRGYFGAMEAHVKSLREFL